MPKNAYRCDCGKVFKTAQGLAGHQRFCKKTERQPRGEENAAEWERRLSELDKSYRILSNQYAAVLKKINKLEELVDLLIGYVCPAGKNLVGVYNYQFFQLTQDVAKVKEEMVSRQRAFEKEIQNFVYSILSK